MNQRYPAVRFVVRHGALLAWLIPVIVAVLGAGSLMLGCGVPLAAGAIVGAIVLFFILRIIVELIQIIAETLLPQ